MIKKRSEVSLNRKNNSQYSEIYFERMAGILNTKGKLTRAILKERKIEEENSRKREIRMNFKKNKAVIFCFMFYLIFIVNAFAQNTDELLLDDFEGNIVGGEEGTVDYGSGNGSIVEVKGSKEIKYHGEQAMAVTFEAVSGGYMWIARGYDLTVKGAGSWLVEPKDIDFSKYNAIAFYMHGADTKNQVAVDIVDNGSEYWRYLIEDNSAGWKEVVIPFKDFFCRGDWQPDKADKNGELNFPLKAFQFEPRPESKGTICFDYVRLVKK